MSIELSKSESDRLLELEQLQLLNTLSEASYDAVVKLASILCETPIAFFGLMDQSLQWYKAKVGIVEDSLPRDLAYCQFAMQQPDEIMVVPDAKKDQRLSSLPIANTKPAYIFYAGMPIKSSTGLVMGVLCVIDYHPRGLSDVQRDGLKSLGIVLQNLIDQRKQSIENEHELSRLNRAVNVAELGLWDYNIHTRKGLATGRFSELLGLEPNQFDGSVDTFLQFVHPDDLNMFQERHRRELELHDFQRFEFRIIHRNGSIRWLVAHSGGIFSRDGKLTHITGLIFDRTEQRLVEEQLHHYHEELLASTKKLEGLSLTDGLTGIKNRRAFDEALNSQVAYSQRRQSSIALLMIDVDNFKSFNDEYGHPAGDEVLKIVARLIQDTIRTEDTLARYGGEEFSLVLPQADIEAGKRTAERIRANIQSWNWQVRNITVSIGVASQYGSAVEATTLLQMADECLYQAKTSGRNKVCS
jgi:diguanylate cyclase (GGDEF)-like protein/PAS domain S-box-containing protein